MLYAMSDVHGHYDLMVNKIKELGGTKQLCTNGNKLIFLGDYIDRGPDSFKVLDYVYNLEKEYGSENVVVLMGNHEQWFVDFLVNGTRDWLGEDGGLCTSKTFLSVAQYLAVRKMAANGAINKVYDYVRKCIMENHKELIKWLKGLRLYYKTDKQIYVHAGIDEEAGELWELGTADYYFTGKYPPTIGSFYMDIIAGHVSVATASKGEVLGEIYFDGMSHYYIDGSVSKNKRLLVLGYDEKSEKYVRL